MPPKTNSGSWFERAGDAQHIVLVGNGGCEYMPNRLAVRVNNYIDTDGARASDSVEDFFVLFERKDGRLLWVSEWRVSWLEANEPEMLTLYQTSLTGEKE